MNKEPGIVVIGGGTGLSVLLKGLKQYTHNLTALVTVSDDGGSSGLLRSELGVLPPGDIRNCLVALAEKESLMNQVFQYRFHNGDSIAPHSLGNLLLVAMSEITGDFVTAIQEMSRILAVRGRVIPSTLEPVQLKARMSDGREISGETAIRRYGGRIVELALEPACCRPLPDSIRAIHEADAIVLGPGSLYTSIVPHLLVEGMTEAIARSSAVKIYVNNVMTEKGETDHFSAFQHLQTVMNYLKYPVIDYMLVNSMPVDRERLERYEEEDAEPVLCDIRDVRDVETGGVKVVARDFLSRDQVAWHDPDKLALAILDVLQVKPIRRLRV